VCAGSIEEKIYQRQLLKNGISKEIIDDAEEHTHKFSQTTLKNLFQLNPLSDGCDTHNMINCPCLGHPNDRSDI
jgi:DNA repair and recombination protein RAD54B